MLDCYQKLKCSMSLKLHFMDSHVEYFPENRGDYSKEQGERLRQDIKVMQQQYQGRENKNIMVDHCWMLKIDAPQKESMKRKMPQRRSFECKCRQRKSRRVTKLYICFV